MERDAGMLLLLHLRPARRMAGRAGSRFWLGRRWRQLSRVTTPSSPSPPRAFWSSTAPWPGASSPPTPGVSRRRSPTSPWRGRRPFTAMSSTGPVGLPIAVSAGLRNPVGSGRFLSRPAEVCRRRLTPREREGPAVARPLPFPGGSQPNSLSSASSGPEAVVVGVVVYPCAPGATSRSARNCGRRHDCESASHRLLLQGQISRQVNLTWAVCSCWVRFTKWMLVSPMV